MTPRPAAPARSPGVATVAALLGEWSAGSGTLSERLASAFARTIAQEDLPPGARLPSERTLAAALAVSRTTIVSAYERLRQEGIVESRVGSGTRVLPRTGDEAAPPRSPDSVPATSTLVLRTVSEDAPGSISFVAAHLPGVSEILDETLAKSRRDVAALARGHGYMPLGLPALRDALARHLSARGLPTKEEQVLITNGAQNAIGLAASLLLSPGDEAIVEDPTYPGALDLFGAARVRFVPVSPAAEADGVERIAAALRRPRAKLLYLLPTFHNPTGAVLAERPRREIARLAEQAGVTVLEDHTLSDLALPATASAPPPPPPIATFARKGPVLTVGSLSKLYWGGLRIGWIRGPEPLIHRLARRKAMDDLGSSVLSQAVAVRLLERADEVAKLRRKQALERLDALARGLARHLPDWEWKRPAGGLALWVRLPRGRASEFAQVAARHGVAVLPGSVCSPTNGFADHLRLAFVPEPEEIREGVERLAKAWTKYGVARETSRARVGVIV
jgi:DNA-binding transcriptional MocR family regulator